MRFLLLFLLILGCSEAATPMPDSSMPMGDAAPMVDSSSPGSDSGDVCELDAFEPDDLAPWVTFDATRDPENVPRFSHLWEGTWATVGAFDVDRLRINVPQELAMVGPEQIWTTSVSDAREVQVDIICEVPTAIFVGCTDGTLVNPRHCRRIGDSSVVVAGACDTGGATYEMTAWQEQGAPCERTIRVEFQN